MGSEHRLLNWRGRSLISDQDIVQLIASTKTATGLSIACDIDWGHYPKGIAIPEPALKSSISSMTASTVIGTILSLRQKTQNAAPNPKHLFCPVPIADLLLELEKDCNNSPSRLKALLHFGVETARLKTERNVDWLLGGDLCSELLEVRRSG